ncbi:DMT family transporter [Psychromonas sp. 14N.309.X.WAT.B.A12]|uniref:DMT family transporter n=1 Tax=unclassified Psychromonas TaxID=2614957 RepID=UPI0025AF233B|nr:DMT family transporter [Psychromonas sp. 14N.309.X.WAT.B.A12]MDN2664472.1 DMT family transporter [Psychromonas sp. 14N.309.X.WAT.B.A12]
MPAVLCFLIATFLWGSSFITLKVAIDFYPPNFVIFLRMLITLLICLCLWRWVKRFKYQQGDWKWLLIMSFAEPCLYYLFEGHAMQYTSASQAGVIVSCLPLLVAFFAYFLLQEKLSKNIVIGFSLCITGGILLSVVSPHTDHAPNPLLGNSLEALAMVCAAIYVVAMKHLLNRYSALSLIALQGLSGTLFFAPFLIFMEWPQQHDFYALMNIVYLGSAVTLGAYGMYNYGLQRSSVLTAAAYSNLVPVFALLLSAILLNEVLTYWQWLSIFVVFIGIMVSKRHEQSVVEADLNRA